MARSAKWAIVKYHFENNKFFKNKMEGSLPESWDEIPFMEKKDFQNDINKLLSIGYSKIVTYQIRQVLAVHLCFLQKIRGPFYGLGPYKKQVQLA